MKNKCKDCRLYSSEWICDDECKKSWNMGCSNFLPVKKCTINGNDADICVMCGGINDQIFIGKMFCSDCEKKYCNKK